MVVLIGISYINATIISNKKAATLVEINDVVEEMKLIRSWKKKAGNAEDF